MTKKITFSLLAIIISGCLIISAGVIAGAWFLLKSEKNYTPPTQDPVELLSEDEQMDLIQEQVSEIRGLQMNSPLDRAMLTSADLEDMVVNDFFKDYTAEDARDDVNILSAIGLLDKDFELLQFYKDLYSEQIAGFYDSETKEMNVVSDSGFHGLERMTYAHEFTHVLQDQNYDLQDGLKLNDETCEQDSEYCAAVTALIEGDATLSEQYWFLMNSTNKDKTDVSDFQSTYESPIFDSAPAFMRQDFLFPYQQGMSFVNSLYSQNKWESVDEAYLNPPVSTEQILHPEKYPDEKPLDVDLPDLVPVLGDGWSEIDRNQMGEWYTYLILSMGIDPRTRLNDKATKTASEGWGGDEYAYFDKDNSPDYVFLWLSAWDTRQDAEEFFMNSSDYGKLRWGETSEESEHAISWGKTVSMHRQGSEVLWIISNNPAAAKKALSTFSDFKD